MNDRIFLRIPVAEVPDDSFHVGVVEQLHNLAHAQLIKIDTWPTNLATPPADVEKSLHKFLEERVRNRDLRGQVVGCIGLRVGDPSRKQAVRNRLGVHVSEAIGIEIVDQGILECLHEPCQRATLRLDPESRLDTVANSAS